MTPPAQDAAAAAVDLGSLAAISDAVESGLGLPEVVRAAARALDASLVLIDRSSSVLAVAARSTADERALMTNAPGVSVHELRVGDAIVGRLRLRGRAGDPPAAFLRVITTLIASEVERLRAPDRASEAAQAAFVAAIMRRKVTDRGDIVARGGELGLDLAGGGAVVVVRAHHYAPADDDWRGRVLRAAERAARSSAPGSLAALLERTPATPPVALLLPATDEDGVAPRRRGDRARALGRPARLHLRGRPLARRDRPGRPLPRRPRGAAGRQRRRGAPGRGRRRPPRSRSRTPAPTGCCCPP